MEIANLFKSMKDLPFVGGVFEALGNGLSFITDRMEIASKTFLEGKKALLKEDPAQMILRRGEDKNEAYQKARDPGGSLDPAKFKELGDDPDLWVKLGEEAYNKAYEKWSKGWNKAWAANVDRDIYQRDMFGRIKFEDAEGNVESGGSGEIADLFAKVFKFKDWEAVKKRAAEFKPLLIFRKAFDGMPEVAAALLKGAVTNLDKALGISRGKVSKFAKWLDEFTTTKRSKSQGRGGLLSSFLGTAVSGPFAQEDDHLLGPVALERMARAQADDPKIKDPISLSAIASGSGVTLSDIAEGFDKIEEENLFPLMAERVKKATEELMLMEISMTRLVQAFEDQSASELEKILAIEGLDHAQLQTLHLLYLGGPEALLHTMYQ